MKIRMAMAVAAIALTPGIALAQSATVEGARDGAATGNAIGGPVGGFMNTAAQLVGAAAPVISGYLIDATHSYLWVFVIGAALPAIAAVAALFLKDRRVI